MNDFSFWEFLWSLVIIYFLFFALLIIFWVVLDIFRSHDIGGWAKALWLILLVVFPLIGVLAYLIARGHGMAERHAERQQAAKEDFDSYVKEAPPDRAEARPTRSRRRRTCSTRVPSPRPSSTR